MIRSRLSRHHVIWWMSIFQYCKRQGLTWTSQTVVATPATLHPATAAMSVNCGRRCGGRNLNRRLVDGAAGISADDATGGLQCWKLTLNTRAELFSYELWALDGTGLENVSSFPESSSTLCRAQQDDELFIILFFSLFSVFICWSVSSFLSM